MTMKSFVLIISLNLIVVVRLSLSNSVSRTSDGILYPRKRFIPSKNELDLGSFKSRDRLRCIKLCQDSSLCQTIMYDRKEQICTLFNEHIEYGSGRLYEENNENLVTIRLDKDSLKDTYKSKQTKNKDQIQTISTSSSRKKDTDVCDNCEL